MMPVSYRRPMGRIRVRLVAIALRNMPGTTQNEVWQTKNQPLRESSVFRRNRRRGFTVVELIRVRLVAIALRNMPGTTQNEVWQTKNQPLRESSVFRRNRRRGFTVVELT